MKNYKIFTNLKAWQKGHDLVLGIYQLTKKFPKEEKFGITSQLRRAAVSVTTNIAEGNQRYFYKNKIRFYYISRGSLSEVHNLLLIARDINLIDNKTCNKFINKSKNVMAILNGLINKTKSF